MKSRSYTMGYTITPDDHFYLNPVVMVILKVDMWCGTSKGVTSPLWAFLEMKTFGKEKKKNFLSFQLLTLNALINFDKMKGHFKSEKKL